MPFLFNRQSEVNSIPKKKTPQILQTVFCKCKKAEGVVARVEKEKYRLISSSRHARGENVKACIFQERRNNQRRGSKGVHAASVGQGRKTTSRHTQSQTGRGGQSALFPFPLIYSLSEALSPKKGSCSIISMGILMLGTFSL